MQRVFSWSFLGVAMPIQTVKYTTEKPPNGLPELNAVEAQPETVCRGVTLIIRGIQPQISETRGEMRLSANVNIEWAICGWCKHAST